MQPESNPAGSNDLIYVLAAPVGDVGGAAKASLLLCDALRSSGKRVKLFTPIMPTPAVQQRLAARGIALVVAHTPQGCRWQIPSRLIALQLWQQARRERPALVHVVSLSAEGRYLLRLSPPVPVYLWESTEALPHVKFVELAIAQSLHRAAAVLVPSRLVARNVRQTYGYTGHIGLLPFWVEPPSFPPPTTPHTRSGNFAYVGRMDLDKGFEHLFEAFSHVRAQYSHATLTVCGGGEVETVRRLAEGKAGIEVRGYVNNDEYEAVIAHSDAMVLASLHEGYPLSLLEACGRRKPIIATEVGSIPELFDGRPCALLVPPRDALALAEAMKTLLFENEATYHERCNDAAQLFEAVSSPPVVRQRLLEAYNIAPNDLGRESSRS